MMKVKTAVSLVAMALCLTGCKTIDVAGKEGALIGGAIGGVLANNVAKDNKALWTLAGVAAGAFVGDQISKYLNDQDKEKMADATVVAAETGTPQAWGDDSSQTSGSAKVVKTTADNCKEIEQSVNTSDAGVKTQTVKACKGDDGIWTVVA
jgi:surface antigen